MSTTSTSGSDKHLSLQRLIRNGVANFSRGVATGVVALTLPALLVRFLTPSSFTSWVILIQIATYVTLLEAGLQVSVGKFIAHESAQADARQRDSYYFGGIILLLGCAVIGIIAVILLSTRLSIIFPKIAQADLLEARTALFLIAGSAALGLPASAATGIFMGLERSSVPAGVIGGGRVIQCAVTVLVANLTHRLVPTAQAFAITSLTITVSQFAAVKLVGLGVKYSNSKISRKIFLDLLNYSATLSLWTAAGILVTGLDLPIVAYYDLASVAAYSLSASLISVFVGLASVIFNALLPRTAALVALGKTESVKALMINSTRFCCGLVLVCVVVGFLFAKPIMNLWIGETMAVRAIPFVRLLIIANSIRMLLIPFALILVGSGFHHLARFTPVAEGLANVIASVCLAAKFGGVGVAVGTIVGAVFGALLAVFYAMPRAHLVSCSPRTFLVDCVGRTLVLAVPACVLDVALPRLNIISQSIAWIATVVVTGLIFVTITLTVSEWNLLRIRANNLFRRRIFYT